MENLSISSCNKCIQYIFLTHGMSEMHTKSASSVWLFLWIHIEFCGISKPFSNIKFKMWKRKWKLNVSLNSCAYECFISQNFSKWKFFSKWLNYSILFLYAKMILETVTFSCHPICSCSSIFHFWLLRTSMQSVTLD